MVIFRHKQPQTAEVDIKEATRNPSLRRPICIAILRSRTYDCAGAKKDNRPSRGALNL